MVKRVAVVGMSFRFPGTDTQRYWNDLLEGKDLVTQVEASRWEPDAYLHPGKEHPGTAYTFAAGSIGDISGFDADFFGISPREASLMDPQQRLLLEMGWEAIENAGIKPSSLRGSNCGVYVGIASADYSYRLADDFAAMDSSTATGNTASIAANRLSYVFDLRGPSMAVDTACSSAMVAFHQACRAIASGEVGQALAGGVSLHLHPYGFIVFSKASMLSPNGRCRVFDASGDGYVRSEGGGLFLLKDYDQAVADGDPIIAVVANSVVNTDGRKSGLTVPSADAQIALMRQAYEQAGIPPADIDYLEAHGTGTPVGDPIETRAIGMALGQTRGADNPLPIGSIKSNLGHLEAASGVAGLVKALYSLRHRTVPATIGIEQFNPNIQFDDWNIRVVTQPRRLRATGTVTIGVNSFGFGGANAHVILQTPPEQAAPQQPSLMGITSAPVPVVVTGRNAGALRDAARDMARMLREQPDRALYDLAYHAAMRREWHDERAVVFGTDNEHIADALEQLADDAAPKELVQTGARLPEAQGPVFVFSGNGSQWPGMGRKLLASPVFAEAVSEVDALFLPLSGWSLAEAMKNAEAPDAYAFTEVAQPALFALQVGMTRMLAQHGVQPAAVVGHSVGEVAAAWASGALTLADAVRVIYHRSQMQGRTKGLGRMAAVGVDGASALALLAELGLQGRLCVAGYNSTGGATLAGDPDALDMVGQTLAERRVFYKQLDLDYAFHSPAMDGIEAPLREALGGLQPQAARIPFHSAVSGGALDGAALDADYWWRNIRQPVRFEQAMAALVGQGDNVFVEIGPAPVLRSYANDALKHADKAGRVLTTGHRGDDAPARVQAAAGLVLASGANVNWTRLFPWAGNHVALPAYPWQRERCWHPMTTEALARLDRRNAHPLLGHALRQQAQPTWENHLDTQLQPWLADHVVGHATVFPGSGFAEIALAAARQWQPAGDGADIEEIEILAPLLLAPSPSKITRLHLDESDGRFWLRGKELGSGDPWTLHASGRVLTHARADLLDESAPPLPGRRPDFTGESHLALTRMAELAYGPAFQAVSHGWLESRDHVLAVLQAPEALADSLPASLLHPALLDCTFQLIIQMLKDDAALGQGIAYVPAKIGRLRWRELPDGPRAPHLVSARLLKRSPHSVTAEFSLFDEQGRQIARISEARFRAARLAKAQGDTLSFLDYAAVPSPHPLAPSTANVALQSKTLQPALQAVVQSVRDDGLMARYAHEVDPLLESLCDHYATQALHALSRKGHLPVSTVAELREAAPQAASLLDWLLQRAARLRADRQHWQVDAPQTDDASTTDIWNSLLREYPDYFAIVHAAGRVGLHLQALLTGDAELAAALPQSATPAALARHALGGEAGQRIADTLRARLTQAQQTRAPGQRLGIVEIGADAPLFAPTLCEGLDFAVADYRCASPDSLAVDAADRLRERFPALQTQHIDTASTVDWLADLVVLHGEFATHQAAQHALRYARASLKPGGTLLVSGLQPAAWMDFIFGAQAAWWLPDETAAPLSTQYPPAQWRALLAEHGLQCEDLLELTPDTASGPYLLAATLPVSQAMAASQSAPQPAQAGGWLVLADAMPPGQDHIAHALAEHLSSTHGLSVVLDTQATPETLDERIVQAQATLGRIHGIVHATGLEPNDPLHRPRGPEALLQAQVARCALAAGLAQACARHGIHATLYLLTRGAAPFMQAVGKPKTETGPAALNDASLWLYGRAMANEASGFAVRLVDLPRHGPQPLESLVRELLWPDAEQEIALGSMGERHAPRLRRNPRPQPAARGGAPEPRTERALRLGFDLPGQLRNLRWETHTLPAPMEHELEIRVQATGLNFRDVMYTLGLLSDEAIENGFAGPTLGLEFAGIVERVGSNVIGYKPGDAVVGFGPASFGNRVITQASAISRMPLGMDFEAAATIPSTFFTVYYALKHLARLEPGERLLIHGAAGGVGIAAIQFAQWAGAEIHATAGSDEKRDFLRLMGVEHVYDSRSLDFADDVLAATGGQGVDVVLNSLAGEAINRNLRVLKPFGRFLELGKRDFYENTRIGLRPFRNNISYFGIDADQLMSERPDLTRRLFGEVMGLFADGVLHPLPYQVFDANEVVDAFRHMQQARQIGKIVITYRRGIQGAVDTQAPRAQRPAALRLSAQATYLVTGGLSGFGLRTAQWLADKGAQHLVLLSRSGPASEEARQAVAALQDRGVTVHAAACDVTDRAALADLLAQAQTSLPPIRGIVHAAMVIDDGLVHNATAEQIERVLAPKILGAMHLDELSRELPLDFFVIHSSGTTLFGNPGQANYVAANGWLEALARQRQARGLPATCPRWGAIADAGFLARNKKIKDALQSRMGGAALPAAQALRALEDMLLARQSVPCDLGVLELDWRALARFLPTADAPRFAWIARDAEAGGQDDEHGADIAHLLATLDDAALHPVVIDMLRAEVSEILRVPADKINPERSIYDMGLDSLMGVELITSLEARFGVRLPVMALSESPTLAKLAVRLVDTLRSSDGTAEADHVAQQVAHVVGQHAQGMNFSSEAMARFTEDIKAEQDAPKRRMIH